jgi:hypothetical protein
MPWAPLPSDQTLERDGADLHAGAQGITQQPVREGKTLRAHIIGKRHALAL